MCPFRLQVTAEGIGDNVAGTVLAVQEAGSYTHIMSASDNFGKNFIPRVAVKLDAQPLSDVMEVESEDTFVRPTYAGNALAKVKSNDSVKLMTIRATNFDKAAADGGSAEVEDVAAVDAGTLRACSLPRMDSQLFGSEAVPGGLEGRHQRGQS